MKRHVGERYDNAGERPAVLPTSRCFKIIGKVTFFGEYIVSSQRTLENSVQVYVVHKTIILFSRNCGYKFRITGVRYVFPEYRLGQLVNGRQELDLERLHISGYADLAATYCHQSQGSW